MRTKPIVYKQGAIYRYIRKNPGCRCRDIAEALKISPRTISNAMLRMKQAGALQGTGKTHNARWMVVGPAPIDGRGCAVASHDNLRANWTRWNDLLILANQAKGCGEETKQKLIAISGRQGIRTGAKSGAGEVVPKANVRKSVPPPIPTLADLIARP